VLDNLSPQVHGPQGQRPGYLHPEVELAVGDVRDPAAVGAALKRADAVVHLAAAVGVGQSMYQVAHYTSTNNMGTAVLLEALIENPVERLVVASSMSLYGEGLYQASDGRLAAGAVRKLDQLRRGEWELRDERGEPLTPVPTPESKPPVLVSVYALSKYDQERLCLMIGEAYNIPTVALRFFNVYGPNQALSNPYTGVMAIFASRLLNDKPPLIFEDGRQRRDFVSVHDVASACALALESEKAAGCVLNIGSGRHATVLEIAEELIRIMGKAHLAPQVNGRYRVGDIRHCFADIGAAERILGYRPQVALADGLSELVESLEGQAAQDRVEQASGELERRGLTI